MFQSFSIRQKSGELAGSRKTSYRHCRRVVLYMVEHYLDDNWHQDNLFLLNVLSFKTSSMYLWAIREPCIINKILLPVSAYCYLEWHSRFMVEWFSVTNAEFDKWHVWLENIWYSSALRGNEICHWIKQFANETLPIFLDIDIDTNLDNTAYVDKLQTTGN